MNNVTEILYCWMVGGDKVFPLLNYSCCHFMLVELCQHIASLKYTHKYFNFKAFLILPVLRCFLVFLHGLGTGGWVLLSFVVFCWWVVWGVLFVFCVATCPRPAWNLWTNVFVYELLKKKKRNLHKCDITSKENFLLHKWNLIIVCQCTIWILHICLGSFYLFLIFSQAELPPRIWHLY